MILSGPPPTATGCGRSRENGKEVWAELKLDPTRKPDSADGIAPGTLGR
jgi:hypothetical protein